MSTPENNLEIFTASVVLPTPEAEEQGTAVHSNSAQELQFVEELPLAEAELVTAESSSVNGVATGFAETQIVPSQLADAAQTNKTTEASNPYSAPNVYQSEANWEELEFNRLSNFKALRLAHTLRTHSVLLIGIVSLWAFAAFGIGLGILEMAGWAFGLAFIFLAMLGLVTVALAFSAFNIPVAILFLTSVVYPPCWPLMLTIVQYRSWTVLQRNSIRLSILRGPEYMATSPDVTPSAFAKVKQSAIQGCLFLLLVGFTILALLPILLGSESTNWF